MAYKRRRAGKVSSRSRKQTPSVAPRLTARPITRRDFPLIAQLFGGSGACGGCWCMLWRVPSTGAYWESRKGARNRAALRRLVTAGSASGCLAFDGSTPVGWCSCGPRASFAYLGRSRKIPPAARPGTWAITCFYVAPAYRRCGVSRLLVRTACGAARAAGAPEIEGYPARLRGADAPPAFVHTGLPGPFEREGFDPAGHAGARTVYVKRLSI